MKSGNRYGRCMMGVGGMGGAREGGEEGVGGACR